MNERKMSGVGRFLGRAGRALVAVAVMAASVAQAQTPVTPPGAGTAGNPYQISQLGHLVWMAGDVGSSSGKVYTVQNDIDASDTTNTTYDGGAGFAPIGNIGTNFMGIFNGNGKVIRNLTINRPSQSGVGLFGYVGRSGAVENLGLEGGSVTGSSEVGGLAGVVSFGIVRGCYATGEVTGNTDDIGGLVGLNGCGMVTECYATGPVTGTGTGYNVGGLVGLNDNSVGLVSRCYATGRVAGYNCIGGLVGQSGSLVSECYATGSVTGNSWVAGLAGYIYDSTVSVCYATGPVMGNSWVGGLVGEPDPGTTTNSYWDTNTTGWATSQGGTGKTTAQMKLQATFAGWDFTNVWRIVEGATYPFFGVAAAVPAGAGLLADPYQISQLGHLVWMGDNVGASSGKYYTMQNDIDASATLIWDTGAGFMPIGNDAVNFLGIFNGGGKVIRNLRMTRPSQDYVGLFGYVGSGAEVRDLGLAGGAVTGSNYVGGLAGYLYYGTVSDCYATGPVTGSGGYVGGLVGYSNYGPVSDCHAAGAVTGSNFVGGLLGQSFGGSAVVSGCYATGPVTGNSSVGGLLGMNDNGSVSGCYATGPVTGISNVGGLLGYTYGYGVVVNGSYATGPVTGSSTVGGLVGENNFGTVDASYWDTNTTGQATSWAGGIGKTTAEMKQQATFVSWDFATVWDISENTTYPYFIRQALGPFAGAADLGGSWMWLSWFEYFSVAGNGWIYHNEHGWMYVAGTSPQSVWFWTSDLGWVWTSATVYPYLYRSNPGAWLWYQKGSDNPRWFYSFGTSGWESY